MSTSFCTSCGSALAPGAAFCSRCGRSLSAAPSPAPRAPSPPVVSGPLVAFLVLAACVLVVMIAGGGWFLYVLGEDARATAAAEELVDFAETQDTAAATTGGAGQGEEPREDFSGMGATLEPGAGEGTYELSAVDEPPVLLNRDEFAEAMRESYPPLLRDAGVEGHASVRFRVNADGTVDPATVTVTESTHEEFGAAAARLAPTLRFEPARLGEGPVAVWAELPVEFQVPPP